MSENNKCCEERGCNEAENLHECDCPGDASAPQAAPLCAADTCCCC